MTWNAFHNRGETLRRVITVADQRRDGTVPRDVPGIGENFSGDLDLVAALMLKWHARLSGNIERELARQPMDLEAAVARAWRLTSDEMPGVRAIVDRHIAEPLDEDMAAALGRAREREWLRLAGAAGLASDESRAAARAGARIESRARELPPVDAELVGRVLDRPGSACGSLVERIKAVIAA